MLNSKGLRSLSAVLALAVMDVAPSKAVTSSRLTTFPPLQGPTFFLKVLAGSVWVGPTRHRPLLSDCSKDIDILG